MNLYLFSHWRSFWVRSEEGFGVLEGEGLESEPIEKNGVLGQRGVMKIWVLKIRVLGRKRFFVLEGV